MKPPRDLKPELKKIRAFLEKEPGLLLSAQAAAEFSDRLGKLSQAWASADDRIVLGLVGGTGVGKSTLINALASKEISASTEVRPTTNRLVLYRHRDNDFAMSEDEKVHVHEIEALARISLVDFPDFDSLEQSHRLTLARHFPELDLLLWVADPAKYADQAFFDWLALAPLAEANCIFIFNKIDEFRSRYGSEAPKVAREATADFKEKLIRHGGLTDPEIYSFSAKEALTEAEPMSQPGFAALWRRIEELSEKKLRLSIKTLNLEARTEAFFSDLAEAVKADWVLEKIGGLKDALAQARKDFSAAAGLEAERIQGLTAGKLKAGLASPARDNAPWPLDFFLFIWDALTGLFPGRKKGAETDFGVMPPPELTLFYRRLEAWRSELESAFGWEESPPGQALRGRLAQGPGPKETTDRAGGTLIAAGLARAEALRKKFRWRIKHHLAPLLVLVYPFLPLIMVWLEKAAGGDGSGSRTLVEVSVSWGDVWPLLLTVLAVYLLETMYFSYSLNKAAGRLLIDTARWWGGELEKMAEEDHLEPVEGFLAQLEQELKAVSTLTKSENKNDGQSD